jgi:DNA-binding FadR family transcriptional regulator
MAEGSGSTGKRASEGSLADVALLRPVRTGNAFEETVELLLRAIKLGVVTPGERLPAERELSQRLSVSRVTLREALRALELEGYVDVKRGRYGGTFINDTLPRPKRTAKRDRPSMAELEDVLTLREVLEPGAAAVVANVDLGDRELALLEKRLVDCERVGDTAEYRRMDSRLHLTIAELSGSASLVAAVADVRVRTNALLDCIPRLSSNLDHSNKQHRRIVAAIERGDADRARRAVSEHLAATAALLRGFLG